MNYVCPYCNQHTTITSPNRDYYDRHIDIDDELLEFSNDIYTSYIAVACPNTDCKRLTFVVELKKAKYDNLGNRSAGKTIHNWKLLPESHAKPQPDYIPQQIVEDYTEACKISQLSPKASATLARRCLQGMIRDFHGIKKDTLNKEITALKGVIPNDEWQAIDALRSIGNIGAHMEKDVNLIVSINEGEADKLIAFIEYLFKQWYVKRHDDQENLATIKALAGIKKAEKKPATPKIEKTTSTDTQQTG